VVALPANFYAYQASQRALDQALAAMSPAVRAAYDWLTFEGDAERPNLDALQPDEIALLDRALQRWGETGVIQARDDGERLSITRILRAWRQRRRK